MAKAGVASRTGRGPGSAATRQALVLAAIETLQEQGYAGASARSIAARAGCNQALVFYHFGSVVELLLAALDDVSARRMERYQAAAAGIGSLGDLVEVASTIFEEDLDRGYVAVLAEMIAGASSTPGLGAAVAARMRPWSEFARETIQAGLAGSPMAALLPVDDIAHVAVALYLGLEMLSHLEGERSQTAALFDHGRRLVPLLAALTGSPQRPGSRPATEGGES